MSANIARRLLLMIPTLLGILFVSFVVIQFAPGGPVERIIAQLTGNDISATSRVSDRTASSHDPDLARDPVRFLRRYPVRAGRPGGAYHRAAHRQRHIGDLARFRSDGFFS